MSYADGMPHTPPEGDPRVIRAVASLRSRLGEASFDVVEFWGTECCAIGSARDDVTLQLAFISASAAASDRWSVALERAPLPGRPGQCESAGSYTALPFDDLARVVGQHLGRAGLGGAQP